MLVSSFPLNEIALGDAVDVLEKGPVEPDLFATPISKAVFQLGCIESHAPTRPTRTLRSTSWASGSCSARSHGRALQRSDRRHCDQKPTSRIPDVGRRDVRGINS
jgi:hypothetical protein